MVGLLGAKEPEQGGPRSRFSVTCHARHDCNAADWHIAVCIVPKADGSGPDGTCKFVKSTSKPLEKYIRSTYPDLWKKKDALINPHKHGDTSNVEDLDVPAENYRPMCKTNVDECNQELVRWFMKHDRPKHMVCDEGLAAFIQKVQLLPGLYELPNEEELGICYKRRGVLGVTKAEQWVLKCKAQGHKPSIAGDIWGQGDLSILAIVGYVKKLAATDATAKNPMQATDATATPTDVLLGFVMRNPTSSHCSQNLQFGNY